MCIRDRLHAVHARHLDVQQRNIELRLLDRLQSFPGAPGGPRRIPLAGKPLAQRIAHYQFVVDDQDSALGSSCRWWFHYACHLILPLLPVTICAVSAHSLAPASAAAVAGSATRNSVPAPGSLRTVISPACCSIMLAATASPRPVRF